MNPELKLHEEKMTKTISVLREELAAIRAGRANPAVLDKLEVDYYGVPTRINQLAAVSVSEARTLVIQPYDKSTLKSIEKAIQASDIGINPNNDGTVLRLLFPPLTEERRKDLAKSIAKMGEESKVAIRSIRRDANDTFDLLDDIEKELGIATCPINWPIGSGKGFKGVYDRNTKEVMTFSDTLKGTKEGTERHIHIDDPALVDEIGEAAKEKLLEEIELLDGASAEFDMDLVSKGELSPVFFGSALTNFGVETFLQHFLKMTYSPLPRKADIGEINPFQEDFSAFVFKIQANMNKAHRDRIAFMRICSGKFEAGMEVTHVQGGNKKIKLSQPQQMMAQERHIVDEAYAGDIIGVFDPGIFSIGDTLTTAKPFKFEGIPTFAPEHFARVRQVDTMKRKQFMKGMQQIAQEGAIQIFQEYNMGMEEVIVGVVGVLQFDVLKYRLENEYNVEIRMDNLPYEHIRWIENEDINMDKIVGTSDMKKIQDLKGRPLLLFVNSWSVGMVLDRNEGLVLSEFGRE